MNKRVWPATFLAGSIVLLLTVFVLQQKFSAGERQRFERDLAATGVRLDWPALIPPAPRDEDNFYAATLVQHWFPAKGTTAARSEQPGPPVIPSGWFASIPPSMEALRSLPARGEDKTLEALGQWFDRWDKALAELREAAARPECQLPGDYSSPERLPVPNFIIVRTTAQALQTRASVHLLQGRSDLALIDLDSIAALMRTLDSKPVLLVSAMIRVAIGGLYLQTVKDGFTERAWKAEDLDGLRDRLEKIDLVTPMLASIREGEMAGTCYLLKKMADGTYSDRRQILGFMGQNKLKEQAMAFIPANSVRRNLLLVATLLNHCLESFEADGSRFYPQKNRAADAELRAAFARKRLGNALAGSFVPSFSKASVTSAKNQTRVHQAIIVCALEQYRLQHGNYPQKLSALPQPPPKDLISGGVPGYRSDDPDTFVLYSIGEDLIDDGGTGDDWRW